MTEHNLVIDMEHGSYFPSPFSTVGSRTLAYFQKTKSSVGELPERREDV